MTRHLRQSWLVLVGTLRMLGPQHSPLVGARLAVRAAWRPLPSVASVLWPEDLGSPWAAASCWERAGPLFCVLVPELAQCES